MMVLMPAFRPPLGSCPRCVARPAALSAVGPTFKQTKHWKSVPNQIPLTSQNPYLEAIGRPYVWVVEPHIHAAASLEVNVNETTTTLHEIKADFERREEDPNDRREKRSRRDLGGDKMQLESERADLSADSLRAELRRWAPQGFVDRLHAAVHNSACGRTFGSGWETRERGPVSVLKHG